VVGAFPDCHLDAGRGKTLTPCFDQVRKAPIPGNGIAAQPGEAEGSGLRFGSGYRQENVRKNCCTTRWSIAASSLP
jgi:hypothetical protein